MAQALRTCGAYQAGAAPGVCPEAPPAAAISGWSRNSVE